MKFTHRLQKAGLAITARKPRDGRKTLLLLIHGTVSRKLIVAVSSPYFTVLLAIALDICSKSRYMYCTCIASDLSSSNPIRHGNVELVLRIGSIDCD